MSLKYLFLAAVAVCIGSGDIALNLQNGDTSEWYPMTCSSAYCSNTTTFTLSSASQCYNPQLSVHFRITDFFNSDSQYLSIAVNQQKLGFCTGPNNASFHAQYNASSIPLYRGCLNDFSIAELVGYNPSAMSVQLSLSPHVADARRAYNGYLLYALVAISCSDTLNNQIVSKDWDPSTLLPAFANLQCVHSGCEASAHFNVIKPERCKVPLLSLNFWLTDFDKDYEYLAVEVNGEYLGICQGGQQIAMTSAALSSAQLDAYWNNYTFWCFQQIDVSRYTGLEPAEIEVRVRLQETVDRNYLDASPTSFLLDAMVEIECGQQTQNEVLPSYMSYDARTSASPQQVTMQCHEVECGAIWNWQVLGQCAAPVLSVSYAVQHFDDVMFEVRINEQLLGTCGPTSTSTSTSQSEHRTCFERVEFLELVSDYWQHEDDAHGDDMMNEFIFGVDLTEIDVLDGVQNGTVALILVHLDCAQQSELKNEQTVHIMEDVTTADGRYPTGSTALSCAHAGCSVTASFILDVEFTQCEIPKLDVYFFLTDLASASQYIAVEIDGHLYGWCDGGQNAVDSQDVLHTCLHRADIEEWVDWQHNGNSIHVVLNASTSVRALDHAKDGSLLSAVVGLTCESRDTDTKHVWSTIDVNASSASAATALAPVQCQGVGCFVNVFFRVTGGHCYRPTLTVAFWLSDFLSFDEYTTVLVNDNLLQKCYGGSDEALSQIWTCFADKDIQYLLHNYAYNHHSEIAQYYVAQHALLNVTLKMSKQSVWLDHSKNNSILEGHVRLTCQATAIAALQNETREADDTDLKKVVALTLNIHKVSVETLRRFYAELASRFEYSLDAVMHFEHENAQDRIAFGVRCDVAASTAADVHIYVTTQSHADAIAIETFIAMDIFLFVFQETLRDSHFADSVLESISDVRIVSALPPSEDPTPAPTNAPTNDEDDDSDIAANLNEKDNVLKILFTSASATDWLSFVAVLLLSMFVCVACIGGVAFLCVRQQRQNIHGSPTKASYKQTIDSSADNDTDMDELQGMMDELSRSESNGSPIKATMSLTAKVKQLAHHHGHRQQYAMIDEQEDSVDALPSKGRTIHPALSSAIHAVHATQDLKHEISKAHELVVSSGVLDADEKNAQQEDESSSSSAVELSEEEFIEIDDDQQEKLKPAEHGHQRSDKVLGMNMQCLMEDTEQEQFVSPAAENLKAAHNEKESDSDNVSELSVEQALSSMASNAFAQTQI